MTLPLLPLTLLLPLKSTTPSEKLSSFGFCPKEPLNPADIPALYTTVGAAESTPEHAKLEAEMGFSYHSLLHNCCLPTSLPILTLAMLS
jgi:hypothetical protein